MNLADNLPSFFKDTENVIPADNYKVHNMQQIFQDNNTLLSFKQDLMARGWAMVTPQLDTSEFFATFAAFFSNTEKKQKHVLTHFPAHRFGYFATHAKEGYRYMTANRSKQFSLPVELRVHTMVEAIDRMVRDFWNKTGACLFEPKHNVEHVPLIASAPKNNQRFGLFDIVHYFDANAVQQLVDNLQVHAHADPGVISLSIGATEEGLQMYDPDMHAWVVIPKSNWIVWCGMAAEQLSDNLIKCGVHRVVAGPPRITAWYEMCVESQVPDSVLTGFFTNANEEFKIEKLLYEHEQKYGLSMSKIKRPQRKAPFGDKIEQFSELSNKLQSQV